MVKQQDELNVSGGFFLALVLRHKVRRYPTELSLSGAGLLLPLLQRVSELPREERCCFSLRVLANMTAAGCWRLVDLEPEQVDYYFRLTSHMLLGIAFHMAEVEIFWTPVRRLSGVFTRNSSACLD